MLVLSRTRDETIMIGDDIEITIVDVRGDKVRLGINAPTTIPVHRKEVYDAIKNENAQASTLRPEQICNVAGPLKPGNTDSTGARESSHVTAKRKRGTTQSRRIAHE